jgi:hypothetical protein
VPWGRPMTGDTGVGCGPIGVGVSLGVEEAIGLGVAIGTGVAALPQAVNMSSAIRIRIERDVMR